jgi:hypothetical protein
MLIKKVEGHTDGRPFSCLSRLRRATQSGNPIKFHQRCLEIEVADGGAQIIQV